MAELILGVIALGVAIPSFATDFQKCGKYLYERASAFNKASRVVEDLKKFGYDLHKGTLSESIKLAEWAFTQDDLDQSIKVMLQTHIDQLRTALVAVDKAFDKVYNKDGSVKRFAVLHNGDRAIKQALKDLSERHREFWASISIVEMRQRVSADPLLLSANIFKTQVNPGGRYCDALEPGSHAWLGKAEIKEGHNLRQVSVLIERKQSVFTGPDEIKEIASCLCRQLYQRTQSRRILRCLGYRTHPSLELVFEWPRECSNPCTLKTLLANDIGRGYGGRRPLQRRYTLAKQLAEAVLSVHTVSRVHKNIRPSTIVLFTQTGSTGESEMSEAFLTDWTMLRKVNAPSMMAGDDDWQKDIYRHPRRQGLQPENRYNIGHDIYSLGVCLLEVGLWEPLVVQAGDTAIPCQKYRDVAVAKGHVQPDQHDNTKALTKPYVLQKILVDLAEAEIPQRMGTTFCNVVVACLTCLEGGFGDGVDLQATDCAPAVSYNARVLEPLTAISI
ncbi:hypothetical protein LTR67_008794 [Exophiala xenobiotica]